MNDYKDLIERLRVRVAWKLDYGVTLREMLGNAADAIEALIAERDAVRILNVALIKNKTTAPEELAALKQKIDSAEPVAWMFEYDGMIHNKIYPPIFSLERKSTHEPWNETPLYTLEGIKE